MEALFTEGRKGYVEPLRFVWVATATANLATVATATADLATRNFRNLEPGVSVLFSVPKRVFKRAWKRNLIKRRMRESYRVRKHDLVAAAVATGRHIDIALICSPTVAKGVPAAIPDFKTVDHAIGKILSKILERS